MLSPNIGLRSIRGFCQARAERLAPADIRQGLHAAAPRVAQIIMNTTCRMYPDSMAAKSKVDGAPAMPSADQVAFSQIMRGIHFDDAPAKWTKPANDAGLATTDRRGDSRLMAGSQRWRYGA